MIKEMPTEVLADLEKELRLFNTPRDLVRLGLSENTKSLANARYEGRGFDFIKRGKQVLYPKSSILDKIKAAYFVEAA